MKNNCPYCGKEIDKPDYIKVISGKREFRIYKWDKPVKDFPMPKGFDLAEERDFIDLYDSDKIKMEKYPTIYFTKNRSKKNVEKGYPLSRLYLDYVLGVDSVNRVLDFSCEDGRVVIVK